MNEPINQSILPSLANHVQKMEKFLMKTMCLIHLHLKMKKKTLEIRQAKICCYLEFYMQIGCFSRYTIFFFKELLMIKKYEGNKNLFM